jgi:hypothetical protein
MLKKTLFLHMAIAFTLPLGGSSLIFPSGKAGAIPCGSKIRAQLIRPVSHTGTRSLRMAVDDDDGEQSESNVGAFANYLSNLPSSLQKEIIDLMAEKAKLPPSDIEQTLKNLADRSPSGVKPDTPAKSRTLKATPSSSDVMGSASSPKRGYMSPLKTAGMGYMSPMPPLETAGSAAWKPDTSPKSGKEEHNDFYSDHQRFQQILSEAKKEKDPWKNPNLKDFLKEKGYNYAKE